MKTETQSTSQLRKQLDIRFISIDSMNPELLNQSFMDEHAEKIRGEIHGHIGHLAHEISRTNGYVNIYTHGNSVVGEPQFVNFSEDVWDKINNPHDHIHLSEGEHLADHYGSDHLDHDNYNDV